MLCFTQTSHEWVIQEQTLTCHYDLFLPLLVHLQKSIVCDLPGQQTGQLNAAWECTKLSSSSKVWKDGDLKAVIQSDHIIREYKRAVYQYDS